MSYFLAYTEKAEPPVLRLATTGEALLLWPACLCRGTLLCC